MIYFNILSFEDFAQVEVYLERLGCLRWSTLLKLVNRFSLKIVTRSSILDIFWDLAHDFEMEI